MTCPHCQEAAKFKGYRAKQFSGLLGHITIHRGYYHCSHCGHGHFPWDEVLRLTSGSLTPGAAEVVSLAGGENPFGRAAQRTLQKLAGLTLSESSVQRTAEAAGRRLGERLEAGEVFGPPQPWDWHKDAAGKSCAYVSLDATGVMMQGSNGAKTEGRMAYVGMIFNPQPRKKGDADISKPCDGARYLAGLYTLEELGQQMRRQADQVGMGAAEQWVALTDGGNGLEHWIDVNFPLAAKILDFRHATEYLADLAKLIAKDDPSELLTTWCHTMKHEGGAAILQVLEQLDRRRMSRAAREQHETTCNYIRNNVARMKYPEYLKQGWQIGTGAVESACKNVVNGRLCAGGMRWGESGSDEMCHLRALYRSDPDQWDAFWGHPVTQAA
jgi:hypothetical protein